jgi:hypothetical protein
MLKHGDLSELYVLLARGVRPPPRTPHTPPLAAAQEPPGAPESLASGRLAHQAVHQGWLGGPRHRDGSVGGRGFAPTPNPEPPCLGGGLVYR